MVTTLPQPRTRGDALCRPRLTARPRPGVWSRPFPEIGPEILFRCFGQLQGLSGHDVGGSKPARV